MTFSIYTNQDFKELKRLSLSRWGKYIDYDESALSRVLNHMHEEGNFSNGTIFEFKYARNRLRETREISEEAYRNLDLFGTICLYSDGIHLTLAPAWASV